MDLAEEQRAVNSEEDLYFPEDLSPPPLLENVQPFLLSRMTGNGQCSVSRSAFRRLLFRVTCTG